MINAYPSVHGGYSDIYQGQLAGQLVAVKRPRVYAGKASNNSISDVCLSNGRYIIVLTQYVYSQEVRIMSSIQNHPHILNIVGVTYHADVLSIITPWMNQGTLLEFVKSGKCAGLKQKLILVNAPISRMCKSKCIC